MKYTEAAVRIRSDMDKAGVMLTSDQAAECVLLFREWTVDVDYEVGNRVRQNGVVYECRQAHTSQDNFSPELAPALWTKLDVEHEGTETDPIPYSSGMELFKDKYYVENELLYICIRDSQAPVYHTLDSLVDIYVKRVE